MNRLYLSLIIGIFTLVTRSTRADGGPTLIDTLYSDSTKNWFGDDIVPIGDQNGDGFDDYLVAEMPNKVYLFLGGNPPDTTYSIKFDSVITGFMSNLGDMNNDGFDDFTLIKRRADGRMRLALYYGGPGLTTTPVFEFGDDYYWPYASNAVLGNDVNHNGTRELICRDSRQTSILFFELGPVFDSVPDLVLFPPNIHTGTYGDCILSEDYNADGWPDLVTDLNFSPTSGINGTVLLYWGGPQFDTIPDLVFTRSDTANSDYTFFGSLLEDVGDINYDGYPDIFVDYIDDFSPDSLSFLYWGGPNIDSIPDITIAIRSQKARIAGDVNHDGYNDLITGFASEFSSYGFANIFFGGPAMDSIADVHIDGRSMTGYVNYFAHEVTGLGDINGDGIDDFAIATLQGPYPPPMILLYSGWNGGTDVPYDYQPGLPSGFTLAQNYPNPFNPSTTIEFDVPRRSAVTLSVFNILGQEVRRLIDNSLAAGTYRLEWDGKTSGGQDAGSGVYFYKLTSGDVVISKKMVLLR